LMILLRKGMTLLFRTILNNKYVTKLPVAGVAKVKYATGVELLRLKAGKKKWSAGNIEPRKGLPLFIQSDNKYWYRILDVDHDMNMYRKYIKQGVLYIYFNQEEQERVRGEVEKEGMGYYDYNKIRELVLLDELLDSKERGADYQSKKRAIQLEIAKVRNKTVPKQGMNHEDRKTITD
jgi:hypothetical protein